MAILHDSLLAAATAAKERVSISYKLHPAALQHCVGLLWPQLEAQRGLARQRNLAVALQVGLVGTSQAEPGCTATATCCCSQRTMAPT